MKEVACSTKQNPENYRLIELNQYVVTLDSQCECKSELSLCDVTFLQQFGLQSFSNVMGYDVQRPYVEFLCTRS